MIICTKGIIVQERGVIMSVKFITFLGTGNYEACEYQLNNEHSRKTPYIQEALIDLLLKQGISIDEVNVFLTPEAKEKHWYGTGKLLEALKEQQNTGNFTIKERDISSKQNIETIWGLFEKMTSFMEKNDTIIFDITHSFRYQPMLALLAIHFARVTKNVQIEGIFYGVYESSVKEKIFPVIDLTTFVELQDWITNVYAFTKTGRADMLTDWILEKDKLIRKKERGSTLDLKLVKNLADDWNELTAALQTNRSPHIPTKAKNALESIEGVKHVMLRPVFLPLNSLLTDVEEQIKPMTNDDLILSGLAAIEWCAEHGLFQQAYTMAAELIVSAVCLKYGYDTKEKEERQKGSYLLTKALKLQENNNSILEELTEDEQEVVMNLLRFSELLKVANIIRDYRNDINHAGWKPQTLNANVFKNNYDEWYPIYKKQLLEFYFG